MLRSFIWILSAAGVLCSASVVSAQTKRYNIISIVTDDQGRWTVGAYGNKESRTPNMDRLAREGAIFRNAFVATPVCSPRIVDVDTVKPAITGEV